MPELQAVDHDPFAPPVTVPVDHDPFSPQAAFEAAAARVRAPYAKANARVSGLPDVGTVLGNKLVNTLMAGPNLMGQVAEGSVDPNSPEAIRRSADVAVSTLGYGMMGARPGAAGMAGGRLVQPTAPTVRSGAMGDAVSDAEKNAVDALLKWRQAGMPDRHHFNSQSYYDAKSALAQIEQAHHGDEPGVFWRGTDRKGEHADVTAGKEITSKNHISGESEGGMSVSKGPDLIGAAGYPYGYKVKGDIAGYGYDGEPVLRNVRPVSPIMTKKQILANDSGRLGRYQTSLMSVADQAGFHPTFSLGGRDQLTLAGDLETARHLLRKEPERPFEPAPVAEGAAKTGGLGDFIQAYHGSPHDFDRFDLSKIGTGEGAQAYGHGLYFAENEGVAKGYRDQLAIAPQYLKRFGGDKDAALAHLDKEEASLVKEGARPEMIEQVRGLKRDVQSDKGGKMYQVAIKAPPEHFLDWDKPLSEQSPKVQEAIKKLPLSESDMKDILGDQGFSGMHLVQALNWHPSVAEGNAGRTTTALREAGIPGIKYLDQGSRGKGAGTRNYVVFDDKLIDIMKKYGIAGIGALPALNAYTHRTQSIDHDPFAQ